MNATLCFDETSSGPSQFSLKPSLLEHWLRQPQYQRLG
jgi:hypothetical protein